MTSDGVRQDGTVGDGAPEADRLRAELAVAQAQARAWHVVAEERRRALDRLISRPGFRSAARLLGLLRRVAGHVLPVSDLIRATVLLVLRSLVALPRRLGGAGRERRLVAALNALPAPGPLPHGPSQGPWDLAALVTAVIVTAHQPQRLDHLLCALGRLGVPAVVHDNAGVPAVAEVITANAASHLRSERPRNYAVANNEAVAQVRTPFTLLLNDDVLPLDDTWITRLLAAAAEDVVAVGAQLCHERRGWFGGAGVDLTVQHAGIVFASDGPTPSPRHLARGQAPVLTGGPQEVPAATAACLLVRTAAFRAIGGLEPTYDYGLEDVDLCLRLAEHGRIVVEPSALLLHAEGATRLRDDRRARNRRQAANRVTFDGRFGPLLRRRSILERLGAPAASRPTAFPDPVRVDVLGQARPALVEALAAIPGVRVEHRRHRRPARLLSSGRRGRARWVDLVLASEVTLLSRLGPDRSGVLAGIIDGPTAPILTHLRHRAAAVGEAADRELVCDVLLVTDPALEAEVRRSAATTPVHVLPESVLDGPEPERSAQLRELITQWLLAPRWSVRSGAPSGAAGARWGDTPIARSLANELRGLGIIARVAARDTWGSALDRSAEVTVHLKGRGVAPVAPAQCNLVWVLSHPDEIAPDELDAADGVLAGSKLLATTLRSTTVTPVRVLPQAADGRMFTPGPRESDLMSRVLFIGNTRSVPRPAVLQAIAAGLPLTLIGGGWERFVGPRWIARRHVAADELPRWYRSADLVLADHWDGMRTNGLIANRVFEVLASGTCVVSDAVPGIDELFEGAVATFEGADELVETVERLLGDPAAREAAAARGRSIVLSGHTWAHRAEQLVAAATAWARPAISDRPGSSS